MYDILFFILIGVYGFIAIKISSWHTISGLGFWSEVPTPFNKSPLLYSALQFVCLVLAALSLLKTNIIPLYGGLLLLISLWFMMRKIGREQGFRKYREIHLEILDGSKTDEERASILEETKKTDAQLEEQLILSKRPF